jgi:hypothetical protein
LASASLVKSPGESLIARRHLRPVDAGFQAQGGRRATSSVARRRLAE